ncbi:MAG: DUF481 domain-containing protein [Bacteroidia bacterium]|nr:DUF481 domain-containing protein [Bacteroidia bacterium]NND25625.1 DUF481 domain-containing protein [Flavobacteriaceae bacterium]MBT8278932.1 DUF481 domain-containing protein [Bacteroidia bacterium]NNK59861.1 DUF481 domain-containing protein [Flavobacteriaceae bacterium]NNL32294.1 DUF481 domain-containing protein [Flavobacteriaceae bacterium]
MNRPFLFILFALFFLEFSYSQVVNIESRRLKTDSVFVFLGNLSLSFNDNNGSQVFQFGSGLTSQLKPKGSKNIYLLLGDYALIRANGVDFNNSWFLHFRFRHKFSDLIRFESYVQSQHDGLLDVNYRNLIGAGLRLKLVGVEPDDNSEEQSTFKLYLGNAYMYEEEKSDAFNKRFSNHRHSSYLALTYNAGNGKVSILNVLYYQPLYSNFNDFRLLEQLKIEIPISETLDFTTTFNYYIDSITPKDRKQYSSKVYFGFNIEL